MVETLDGFGSALSFDVCATLMEKDERTNAQSANVPRAIGRRTFMEFIIHAPKYTRKKIEARRMPPRLVRWFEGD